MSDKQCEGGVGKIKKITTKNHFRQCIKAILLNSII